jgi:hypothetical protein
VQNSFMTGTEVLKYTWCKEEKFWSIVADIIIVRIAEPPGLHDDAIRSLPLGHQVERCRRRDDRRRSVRIPLPDVGWMRAGGV